MDYLVTQAGKYSVPKTSGIYTVKKKPGSCTCIFMVEKNKDFCGLTRVTVATLPDCESPRPFIFIFLIPKPVPDNMVGIQDMCNEWKNDLANSNDNSENQNFISSF